MSDSEEEESIGKSSSSGSSSSSEWDNSDNEEDSDDGSDINPDPDPEEEKNLEGTPASALHPENPEEENNNTEEVSEGQPSDKSIEDAVSKNRPKRLTWKSLKNMPELLPRSIDESFRIFVWECDDFVIKAEFNEDVRKIPKPQYSRKLDICPVCNKMCFSLKGLDKHVREIHPDVEKPFVCHCGSKFERRTCLNRHLFHLHTEEGKEIWRKILDAKNKRRRGVPLSREYKDKANERRKQQIRKVKGKGSWSRLGESEFWIDQAAPPPHKCPECEEEFDTITRLRRHHAVNHQDRVNICETCGKSFATRGSLKGHQRTHNDERRYVCDECGISCKTFHHLNIHVKRTHDEQGREEYKHYLREVKRKRKLAKQATQRKTEQLPEPPDIDFNEILYGSSSSTT